MAGRPKNPQSFRCSAPNVVLGWTLGVSESRARTPSFLSLTLPLPLAGEEEKKLGRDSASPAMTATPRSTLSPEREEKFTLMGAFSSQSARTMPRGLLRWGDSQRCIMARKGKGRDLLKS